MRITMNDNELLTNIKASLQKLSLPIADVPGNNSLITGYCQIQKEQVPFNFVIKGADGYSTIYMIAPYAAEAFNADDIYKKLALINLGLARGHFNADSENKQLIYKWVLPLSAFADDCDKMTKEFVVLPAAMIIKYKDKFLKP